jgi:hypothetical protein
MRILTIFMWSRKGLNIARRHPGEKKVVIEEDRRDARQGVRVGAQFRAGKSKAVPLADVKKPA